MRMAPFRGNIVVTNMPEDFTGSALAALFDDFGLVLGAVIERPNGDENSRAARLGEFGAAERGRSGDQIA